MQKLLRRTALIIGIAATTLLAARAAPTTDEQRAPDGSAAGAGERVAPADVSGGSRTIQLLLDLQPNKPSTFESGPRAVRRDEGGVPRQKPSQPALPPQFALPGAVVTPAESRRAVAAAPDGRSAGTVEWTAARGAAPSDSLSVRQQDAGASPSFDNDRPSARHLAWLTASLGVLREHREVVLGACAVVVGLIWLGAAKGKPKRH